MEIGYVLNVFGKDKTRQKVHISTTYGHKDDSKKNIRLLTQQELQEKASVHAKYLLEDNYYAHELITIIN